MVPLPGSQLVFYTEMPHADTDGSPSLGTDTDRMTLPPSLPAHSFSTSLPMLRELATMAAIAEPGELPVRERIAPTRDAIAEPRAAPFSISVTSCAETSSTTSVLDIVRVVPGTIVITVVP